MPTTESSIELKSPRPALGLGMIIGASLLWGGIGALGANSVLNMKGASPQIAIVDLAGTLETYQKKLLDNPVKDQAIQQALMLEVTVANQEATPALEELEKRHPGVLILQKQATLNTSVGMDLSHEYRNLLDARIQSRLAAR